MRWQNPPCTFPLIWNWASLCTAFPGHPGLPVGAGHREANLLRSIRPLREGTSTCWLNEKALWDPNMRLDTDNSGSTLRCPSPQPQLLFPLPLPGELSRELPAQQAADFPALNPALLAPTEHIAASAACQHPSKCSVYC